MKAFWDELLWAAFVIFMVAAMFMAIIKLAFSYSLPMGVLTMGVVMFAFGVVVGVRFPRDSKWVRLIDSLGVARE